MKISFHSHANAISFSYEKISTRPKVIQKWPIENMNINKSYQSLKSLPLLLHILQIYCLLTSYSDDRLVPFSVITK